MVEVYVGTSGWLYDWNEDLSFDWYLRYSGLNAVELNASFYRFPFPAQVAGWRRRTEATGIRWAVKVHRSITHLRRLGEGSLNIWRRFRGLFAPLDDYIDFYLFQMPPAFKMNEKSLTRLRRFVEATGLGERMALELRDPGWFNEDTVGICREIGITLVSIDSPIGTWIVSSNDIVYLRLHGRQTWYSYEYTEEELEEIARAVIELNPRKVYVFFNNNHWMLENARAMKKILTMR